MPHGSRGRWSRLTAPASHGVPGAAPEEVPVPGKRGKRGRQGGRGGWTSGRVLSPPEARPAAREGPFAVPPSRRPAGTEPRDAGEGRALTSFPGVGAGPMEKLPKLPIVLGEEQSVFSCGGASCLPMSRHRGRKALRLPGGANARGLLAGAWEDLLRDQLAIWFGASSAPGNSLGRCHCASQPAWSAKACLHRRSPLGRRWLHRCSPPPAPKL